MNKKEIKNFRKLSEGFWSKLPRTVKPKILIENNINGTYESETSNLGAKVRRFKPWTHQKIWSTWRVGFPMIWKGKTVICWVSGYHCEIGEPIMWLEDYIWSIDTNKPLRKDASRNCWRDIREAAQMLNMDVSDIRFIKDMDVADDSKRIGWSINHKGVDWTIQPDDVMADSRRYSRRYWVKNSDSGLYANLAPSLKMAKAFIKYESGLWLSDRV